MKQSQVEASLLDRLNSFASGPLPGFSLPDEELVELLSSSEYDSLSAEMQVWLDVQLDKLCLLQGN